MSPVTTSRADTQWSAPDRPSGFDGFAAVDRAILEDLCTAGPSRIADLAARTGQSLSNCRARVNLLASRGLLIQVPERTGSVGRPRSLVSLAPAAHAFFPDGQATALVRVLWYLERTYPTIYQELWEDLTGWLPELAPAATHESLAELARRCAEAFAQSGHVATVKEVPAGEVELAIHHCGVGPAARLHPGICDLELNWLRRNVPEARVTCGARRRDGAATCLFRIH